MTKVIEDKINNILDTGSTPDDIDEVREILNALYAKVSDFMDIIDEKSTALSQIYRYNLKQEKTEYQHDDKIYTSAKNVDKLINEYNNSIIMIELLEKKLSKLEN